MIDEIKRTMAKYNMLKPTGERILVGLSGGADSVSLVLVLKKLGFDVFAVHINHNLRGDESLRDQRFCENFCKEQEISFVCESIDVLGYCKEKALSIETGAREIRYSVFNKYANGCKIATAHNATDALETAIFNMARGTGIKGLCGIPATRDNIIRPLIEVSRIEIEKFLRNENQEYVVDSTNLCDDYSRNKIRHNVISSLYEINSGLVENYLRLKVNLESDNDYLSQQSDKLFKSIKKNGEYEVLKLNGIHSALKNRVLCSILVENNIEISQSRVEDLDNISKRDGKINISKNCFAVCKKGMLSFNEDTPIIEKVRFLVGINKKYDFLSKKVLLKLENYGIIKTNINNFFTNPVMDYDKIKGAIYLRNRRDGDKIMLAGRGFTSTVKKLLNEKIPLNKRDTLVFLEDDEGLIFVEGFGPAQRVCCDRSTKRLILIDICDK